MKNTPEYVHHYERRNPKGFLMRAYRNMWSRVTGIQKREAKYYEGLAILPLPVFYAWAMAEDSAFWPLWRTWQAADLNRKLTPSVDRRDATKGYTLDNMQWLTHSQNSAKVRPELRGLNRTKGTSHYRARFTEEQVAEIRRRHLTGEQTRTLALAFGCARHTMSDITTGKSYK